MLPRARVLFVPLLAALAACAAPPSARPGPGGGLVVANDHLLYAVGPDGRNLHFIDRRSGTDYAVREPPSACARIRKGGAVHSASAASFSGGTLTLRFGESGVEAVLRPTARRTHIEWEVVLVRGDGVEELVFADVPLTLKGSLDEPFGAAALALNLRTNVWAMPGLCSRLTASCYPRFGFAGARAALIGCPTPELRRILQEAVAGAPDLPKSPLGGPWALDAPAARGSYLFDFGDVNEKTVDDWIRLLQSLGFTQLDFHGGRSFRFGDCRVNPDVHPRGRAGFKAVIDRLHAAGISAGLHTYAFFIDKGSKWVSPVPDPRLASDATFTLAADLAADATSIPVEEPTAGVSAVTGFFVRNSATLRIDDELIVYGGAAKGPPHGFTACARGACGTRAAPHAKGAKAHHLKECFGLFVPDPETTLFEETAAATADLYNECGFDMMYFDALDGEDILGGAPNGWHYGSRFVFEVWKRLQRPALMEMSTFHHHLWTVRSRMGAWDHPRRAHKRFIDVHVAGNEPSRRMFLPANLGWWAVSAWSGAQAEPTYPDDIEYLCAKALGTDSGLSLMGINPQNAAGMARLAEIFRRYETLRLSGDVPESVKARLRAPGEEFRLAALPDGGWEFRPVRRVRHVVDGADDGSRSWTARNPFGSQPARLRIEALLSAGPYDAEGNVVLADAASAASFVRRSAAPGVTAELAAAEGPVDGRPAALRFTALNAGPAARGAWAQAERAFDPPLNLAGKEGLGVWVHGDGQGEVLNVQLRSPAHLVSGIGDHYVVVDFTGWRYVELVEPEGGRWADYAWPYGDAYAIYREAVEYSQVASLGFWFNNLPPGKPVACILGEVRAAPLAKGTLRNPSVTIGGRTAVFPVSLESGGSLEFDGPAGGFRAYGPGGALKKEAAPRGEAPVLETGDNAVTFAWEESEGPRPRAAVTVIAEGEELEKSKIPNPKSR